MVDEETVTGHGVGLYAINAPIPDLLSDVDPFGLYNVYKHFENSNPPKKLSFILEYYYDSNFDPNDNINYPCKSNYKNRWFNFCKAYDCKTIPDQTDHTKRPEYFFNQYQGFIEEEPIGSGNWVWKADDPNHISVEILRRRGEIFCSFWYQNVVKGTPAKIFGGFGNATYEVNGEKIELLEKGTSEMKARFEKPFDSSLPYPQPNETINRNADTGYSNAIGFFTDSWEVEYIINKFLTYVKANYLNENP
ncbi:MAG: hypothetical protein K2X86_02970 [Cytophagaceae bacterium]|nr:hypothetical protein [Cytophagaceae bacterium]